MDVQSVDLKQHFLSFGNNSDNLLTIIEDKGETQVESQASNYALSDNRITADDNGVQEDKTKPYNYYDPKLNNEYLSYSTPHPKLKSSNTNYHNNERVPKITMNNLISVLSTRFNRLNTSQKSLMAIIMMISVMIYALTMYFFVSKVAHRISTINKLKLACSGRDLFVGKQTEELCIFGVGQFSFGIIAIGQFAFGIVAIGQFAMGFVNIALISASVIITLASQVSVSLFSSFTMLGVSVLYSTRSLIALSPLSALFKKNKKPFCVCE